jgi:type II secretory pathway component GspD/PulD (secretin)
MRRLVAAALMSSWLAGAATAAAEGPSPANMPQATSKLIGQLALDEEVFPGLKNSISLDLRGIDVIEVLKFLAAQGSLNIVTSPEVQGRATLVLTDVSVRDALEIILVSNGLAVERRGKILYVMSGPLYEQLYGLRYSDPRQSLTIQLRYANANQVGTLLSNIKSPVGRIVIDEPTATLAILDVPSVLSQMQSLIGSVDIPTIERQLPTQTKTIPLQFAKAEEVEGAIKSALTEEVGELRLDKRSNALIITDMPARMPQLEALVQAFDARTRQVDIEASILSVTLRDEFDTGIEWTWMSESLKFPDVTVTHSTPIASDATNAVKMVVGTIGENDVTATIKALHHFGDTKVLSSPQIAVMNGEDAKILVGRREAYVTTTVTQAQSTATTAETIEFIDVGVKLFVTPVINETGYVTMKIRPEVSSVVSTLQTSTGNKIPIVETTEAETKVVVRDGRTVMIGGLMKDETTLTKQRIPVLGTLPLVGALFSNRSDRIKKTELVILLTPHVTTGDEGGPSVATARVDWPPAGGR